MDLQRIKDGHSRRLDEQIVPLKEAFQNITVSKKEISHGHIIAICNENFKCLICYPLDWPFKAPKISIIYKGHTQEKFISEWNPVTNLISIYMFVLDHIEKIITRSEELKTQIILIKAMFKDIHVDYSETEGIVDIKYDNLDILIHLAKDGQVDVAENGREWPDSMRPKIESLDLSKIVSEIIEMRDKTRKTYSDDYVERLYQSIQVKFPNVLYSSDHSVFIISMSKELITIGVNPETPYLAPLIFVFRKGIMIGEYDIDKWTKLSDLGEILFNKVNSPSITN